MKTITVEQYQTTDGVVFDDRIQAARHQAALDNDDEISRFAEANAKDAKHATRLKNTLLAFVKWQATADKAA